MLSYEHWNDYSCSKATGHLLCGDVVGAAKDEDDVRLPQVVHAGDERAVREVLLPIARVADGGA